MGVAATQCHVHSALTMREVYQFAWLPPGSLRNAGPTELVWSETTISQAALHTVWNVVQFKAPSQHCPDLEHQVYSFPALIP